MPKGALCMTPWNEKVGFVTYTQVSWFWETQVQLVRVHFCGLRHNFLYFCFCKEAQLFHFSCQSQVFVQLRVKFSVFELTKLGWEVKRYVQIICAVKLFVSLYFHVTCSFLSQCQDWFHPTAQLEFAFGPWGRVREHFSIKKVRQAVSASLKLLIMETNGRQWVFI